MHQRGIIDSSAPPIVLRYWGRHFSAAVPKLTTKEELAPHHDALMVGRPSSHDVDDPNDFTFQTEDLALFCGGPQQPALLGNDVANALVTAEGNYSDNSLTKTDYETPPPDYAPMRGICASVPFYPLLTFAFRMGWPWKIIIPGLC
ncbi:hypothetical protein CCR75_006023 [Bremia lactucae]|uniref:Uncharacterized protein n=1 Tax=Bremia lactucae TaxID=4779 RepID=A0A976FJC9_BRELC|nr:hypothetical protein CCR75_006023 [Bremia lactucae]